MGRGLKARAGAPPAGRFSDGGDDVVADSEGEDDRHEARLSMVTSFCADTPRSVIFSTPRGSNLQEQTRKNVSTLTEAN